MQTRVDEYAGWQGIDELTAFISTAKTAECSDYQDAIRKGKEQYLLLESFDNDAQYYRSRLS